VPPETPEPSSRIEVTPVMLAELEARVEQAREGVTAAIGAKDGSRAYQERALTVLRAQLRDWQRWSGGLAGADS